MLLQSCSLWYGHLHTSYQTAAKQVWEGLLRYCTASLGAGNFLLALILERGAGSSRGLVWEANALALVGKGVLGLGLEAALGCQEAVHQADKFVNLLKWGQVPAALERHQHSPRYACHHIHLHSSQGGCRECLKSPGSFQRTTAN